MKRVQKILAAILASMFILAIIGGCGSSNNASGETTVQQSQSVQQTTTDPNASPKKDGKYDPPVTINVAYGVDESTKFREGETIEDNVHTRWMKEHLGIEIKSLWSVSTTNQGYENKLRLSLSANETLPDVFKMNSSEKNLMNDLIESGKVMAIDEPMDKYLSPRLKELLGKYPEAFRAVTSDGRKYAFPMLTNQSVADTLGYIRPDWLEKLGLKTPETLEEFEAVMDAFVNGDPDGNKQKDTYGMSVGLKSDGVDTGYNNYVGNASWVFGCYGKFMPTYWNDDGSGNLVYGSIQPNMKQGLAKLKEWFEKGYLEKDIGLKDGNDAAQKFIQGKSGSFFGAFWAPIWPLGDFEKNVPGGKYTAFKLPAGPNGQRGRIGSPLVQTYNMFNKDFKHMDAYFDYIDTIAGGEFGEETDAFKYGYAEGYDYVMIDGKPVFDESKVPGGKLEVFKYFFTGNTFNIPGNEYKQYEKIYNGEPLTTGPEMNRAGLPKELIHAGAVSYQMADSNILDQFEGLPTETMKTKNEYLKKKEMETFLKIIYGELPLDAFDEFVTYWKANGGDQITKEVNEWYQAAK
jgi:putative aldouronate transport system substrate-binding protein